MGPDISGTTFFRVDRSLGAKQEVLMIVHFLNKLIVSCKEVYGFLSNLFLLFLNWIVIFIQIKRLFPVVHSDCPIYAET